MYQHHCLGNGNASWEDGLTFIYFFFFLSLGCVDREGNEINFPARRKSKQVRSCLGERR